MINRYFLKSLPWSLSRYLNIFGCPCWQCCYGHAVALVMQTRVEGDSVVVRAKKSALASHKCTLPMTPASVEEDKRSFVIVGGGERWQHC